MEAVTAAIAKQQTGTPPRRRASTRRQTLPGAPHAVSPTRRGVPFCRDRKEPKSAPRALPLGILPGGSPWTSPRMGQTPHTLLSLRGYWKIPCGGNTPSGYAYGAAAQRRGIRAKPRFYLSLARRPLPEGLVPHRSGEHRIRPTEGRPETPGRS